MSNSTATSMIALDNGNLQLSGALNFDTVPALMRQAEVLLAKRSDACIDFSAVVSTNSAGLALLLELLRFARARGTTIQFSHIPEQIAIVARAYGIEHALDSAEFIEQATA